MKQRNDRAVSCSGAIGAKVARLARKRCDCRTRGRTVEIRAFGDGGRIVSGGGGVSRSAAGAGGAGGGLHPAATGDVVGGFYSFLGFTRLTSDAVVRRAIVRGVKESVFGFITSGPPTLGVDGRFQVPLEKVRFGATVADDEVDLESGFIRLPAFGAPVPSGLLFITFEFGGVFAATWVNLPPDWLLHRRVPPHYGSGNGENLAHFGHHPGWHVPRRQMMEKNP